MGSTYQSQAQIIAWIEMVGSGILLVLLFFGTVVLLTNPHLTHMERELDEADPNWRENLEGFYSASTFKKIILLAPSFLYLFSEIALGAYLLQAAEKMHYKKLRLWYVITATYATIMAVLLIPVFFVKNNIQPEVIVLFILGFFFTIYSLLVVRQLRKEIKSNTMPRVMQPSQPYEAAFMNYPNYPEQPPPAYPGGAGTEKQFMKL